LDRTQVASGQIWRVLELPLGWANCERAHHRSLGHHAIANGIHGYAIHGPGHDHRHTTRIPNGHYGINDSREPYRRYRNLCNQHRSYGRRSECPRGRKAGATTVRTRFHHIRGDHNYQHNHRRYCMDRLAGDGCTTLLHRTRRNHWSTHGGSSKRLDHILSHMTKREYNSIPLRRGSAKQ